MSVDLVTAPETIAALSGAVLKLSEQVETLAKASAFALELGEHLTAQGIDDDTRAQLEDELGITALANAWLAIADHASAAAGDNPRNGTVVPWFVELMDRQHARITGA